jgi:hypothetical protein
MEISLRSASRIPLATDLERALSQASAQEYAPPWELAPGGRLEEQLDSLLLLEMRYQQHLAQRGLQDLFEDGALQCLEI